MMKTRYHILALVFLMSMLAFNRAAAQDIEANGIFYNIISDTQVEVASAYFNGANHYEGCIILPERVYCDGTNYDVAAIAPRAFWQSHVTEVQIPNSVTTIGDAAFADAEELASITLPLGLKAVSRYMLAGTAVTSVVLPEGVTDIGKGAFEDCSRLRSVFFPLSLRRIGDQAFSYCVNLQEIYSNAATPPQVLGDNAFEGVQGIQVLLPDEATTRRYQNDSQWNDEEVFSMWIDEGLAVTPTIQQESLGENWTALMLSNHLAYKIYGPDGYLMALTAADRYFLPIGANATDYLVVPTTLMRDEEDLEMVATVEASAIEEIEDETTPQLNIVALDGTIYIDGDIHGMWTYIYDMYGNVWYEYPSMRNWISLPGRRVYIVRVGNTVRKLMLY